MQLLLNHKCHSPKFSKTMNKNLDQSLIFLTEVNTMQKIISASLLVASLISGAAIADNVPPAAATVPGFVVGETVRTEATVVAVNQKDRIVTLKNAEGNVFDVVVGDKVKNFTQVKIGDVVVAEHSIAIAAKLKKGSGLRSTTENTDAARAAPGENLPASSHAKSILWPMCLMSIPRPVSLPCKEPRARSST